MESKFFVAEPVDYGKEVAISSRDFYQKYKTLRSCSLYKTAADAIYYHCINVLRDDISDGFDEDEFNETTLFESAFGVLSHDYNMHEEGAWWSLFEITSTGVKKVYNYSEVYDEVKDRIMNLSNRLYRLIMYEHRKSDL